MRPRCSSLICLGTVHKKRPQSGGCPVRTFCGQGGRGFFWCRPPHFRCGPPHFRCGSPHFRCGPPHFRCGSPHFRCGPPHFRCQPPHFRCQPLHFRCGPPHFRCGPPHFRCGPPHFRCGPPHFLVQKNSDILKFMVSPHGQWGRRLRQCGHFADKGGQFVCGRPLWRAASYEIRRILT